MDDLVDYITRGEEARDLEYKESQPWDALKGKIARTAMAMANLRGGGAIVIGVAERLGAIAPVGMTPEHTRSYNGDDVRAFINSFADPYIEARLRPVEHDGKQFLLIVVDEFDEIPCLSKKASQPDGILEGRMYVRSGRMFETTEVRTHHDLREVLNLATEKSLAATLGLLERTGVSIERLRAAGAGAEYDRELEGL